MADEVLLSGQRVMPVKLLEHGYVFRYADLDKALGQLVPERLVAEPAAVSPSR